MSISKLIALGDQIPGLAMEAENQARAASDIVLQKQVAGTPAQPGLASQIRAEAIGREAKIRTQIGANTAAQQRELGKLALGEQRVAKLEEANQLDIRAQSELDKRNAEFKLDMREEMIRSKKDIQDSDIQASELLSQFGIYRNNQIQIAMRSHQEQLGNLGRDLKSKLLDSRLTFEKTEGDRRFTNERQIADYTTTIATSRMEFDSNMRKLENQTKRKIIVMKQVEEEHQAILRRGYITRQGDLNRAHKQYILETSAAIQAKIAREKSRANGRAARWRAGGIIIGGGLGAFTGTPQGVAAGAFIGSNIGEMAGSQEGV